ncbi:MAG: ISAs1 family transposase [Treponema sp.]|jgi:predicted transposase YbfD/YdcC|nr:ISAs1 family transposase [Treponema sp.]
MGGHGAGSSGDGGKHRRENDSDYLLSVKDNQPMLHKDIQEYFEGLESGEIRDLPEDVQMTGEERGHGRKEQREVRTVTDTGWMAGKDDWKDLKTIIRYRCWRTAGGETARTDRYYISNAEMDAELFYRYLRGRWSIENRLHWSLDEVFREDAARVSKDHAPENLNILRKITLTLLRTAPDPQTSGKKRKMSGPQKRFTAAMNPNYMLTILFEK